MTVGGHTWVGDDSVNKPRGCPEWEKSLKKFDFGETDIFEGKTFWKSATGHVITLNDHESKTEERSNKNGIFIETASGNSIKLNDHSLKGSCVAGEDSGIFIESRSKHTIQMTDTTADTCSPPRKSGGIPRNNAQSDKNFIKLRSGYGLQIEMNDSSTQTQETQNQFIQITAPQYSESPPRNPDPAVDLPKAGPHIMRFQEAVGGGQIFLRAGGDYIISTYDHMATMVGEEGHPANKFVAVSQNYIVDVKDVYFNHADMHVLFAEKYILLYAGRDCPDIDGNEEEEPCLYPVIVGKCPKVCPLTLDICWGANSMSERVYASAGNECDKF